MTSSPQDDLFLAPCSTTLPLMEQELATNPQHLSSNPILVGFLLLNLQLSVYCFVDHCLSICLFSIWQLFCVIF
jgi:hypothetical protein